VHIHVAYRVNQAEYGIRIFVAASQEYVNIYSTRREVTRLVVLRVNRLVTRQVTHIASRVSRLVTRPLA